jgi:hypothetical protein
MTNDEIAARHSRLLEAGWTRRFIAEEPRLTEMKEMYESLGLEARIEPGALGDPEECRACFEVETFDSKYHTIYTRDAENATGAGFDDMY